MSPAGHVFQLGLHMNPQDAGHASRIWSYCLWVLFHSHHHNGKGVQASSSRDYALIVMIDATTRYNVVHGPSGPAD